MSNSDLAAYVRNTRIAKGYTMAELAEALGVHLNTIKNWEAGIHVIPGDKMLALQVLPTKLVVRKPRHGPRKNP